jgi:transposase
MEKNIGKQNSERKRARFSKEFKLEAVRLLGLGQKPATQLALELGIARNQLYKWQAQLGKVGKEQAFHGPGRKPEDERSENERLRSELKRVTEERDILKNGPHGSPRPLCIETSGEYTAITRGQWPSASWRHRPRQKTWPRGSCGPICGGIFG